MLQAPKAFGEKYKPVPPVVKELTQVVYYRANSDVLTEGPANVYVDARYHTSLLPGGFTSFCLKPGNHTLGAFVNDPLYRGKTEHLYQAELRGGRTYYLRVDEQQHLTDAPRAVHRQHGEKELKPNRRQVHAHSRAVTIVPCVFDRASAQSESQYLLSSQVLFKKDAGMTLLSDEGQNSINEVVVTLRQQHPIIHSVVIRLISRGEAQSIQQEKAKVLRTALTLAAVPSELISIQFSSCVESCPTAEQDVQILAM
jgi:OOP family OmpA-OmpF porin